MNPDGSIAEERPIKIHYELSIEKSQIVYDIFMQYLEGYYVWSGNQNRTMFVEFKRTSKFIPEAQKTISYLSNYPMIFIDINLNKKDRKKKRYNFLEVNDKKINILNSKELYKFNELEKNKEVNTVDISWDIDNLTINLYGIKHLSKILKIIGEFQKINKLSGTGYSFEVSTNAYLTENEAGSEDDVKNIVDGEIFDKDKSKRKRRSRRR